MKKTLVGINTLTHLDSQVYSNHCQMWFRLAKQFPEDLFALFTPARASIDRMRNQAAKFALEGEFDYIFFIDDDVLIPFDAYKKLRETNKDIVAGNVVVRGYPFNPMFFKFNDKKSLTFYTDYEGKDKDGVLDVSAVGFSCCLIKVDLLKKMTTPFFITGPNHTEDVYFCMKALHELPKTEIAVRVDVECGHLGYPNIYTPSNKHLFMEMEKPIDISKRIDNSEEYIERCLKSF